MRRRSLPVTSSDLTVLGVLLAALLLATGSTPHLDEDAPVPEAAEQLVLTGHVTPEVRRLVSLVVDAAHRHDVQVLASELEIRFVDRIDPDGHIGGRTDGERILIGCNVAKPERTLLHEVAHAVVGVEYGHGEPWRSVYLTAFAEVFGERRAERELRRIEWVYDKSYLDARTP